MWKTRFCYLDDNISNMKALEWKMKLSRRDKKNYHLFMTHGMRPGKYIVEGLQRNGMPSIFSFSNTDLSLNAC